MPVEYECKNCGRVYSLADYTVDRFCKDCDKHLSIKILPTRKLEDKGPIDIKREDINVEGLFHVFLSQTYPDIGAGLRFKNIDEWMIARKKAYRYYQERFKKENLKNTARVCKDYKEWVLGRNNKSWTNYQRRGYEPLETPYRLASLISYLQNEKISVEERVQEGLSGEYFVMGIGKGILTSLLHTFFPDKYGVWNDRTKDTLEILRRKPIQQYSTYVGKTYMNVNEKLHELKQRLSTDLTYVDGFMWHISKHVRFIE